MELVMIAGTFRDNSWPALRVRSSYRRDVIKTTLARLIATGWKERYSNEDRMGAFFARNLIIDVEMKDIKQVHQVVEAIRVIRGDWNRWYWSLAPNSGGFGGRPDPRSFNEPVRFRVVPGVPQTTIFVHYRF